MFVVDKPPLLRIICPKIYAHVPFIRMCIKGIQIPPFAPENSATSKMSFVTKYEKTIKINKGPVIFFNST